MNIKVFKSTDELAEHIAQAWVELSLNNERSDISLSGGSTPKALFNFIASSDYVTKINWQTLHFWWGDERCVCPSDVQSNYGEAMRLLFSKVLIPSDNLHPIHGELEPTKACIEFKDEMEACLASVVVNGHSYPVYDWILLGIGEDGHTASLFPGQTDYDTSETAVVAQHPDNQQERVSLSAKVIESAKRVSYLAAGENKQDILREILVNGDLASDYPASKISARDGLSEWLLEATAASHLS